VLPPRTDGEWERFSSLERRGPSGEWRRLERVPEGEAPRSREFRLCRRPDGSVEVIFAEKVPERLQVRLPRVRVGLGLRPDFADLELDVVEAEVEGFGRAVQVDAVHGGAPGEDQDAVLRRVRAEWKSGDRAVTEGDIRCLVQGIDPGVARVEVVVSPLRPAEWTVIVLPPPPCAPGRIAASRLERLERYLESKVVLGTRVRVVEPSYVPYRVEISTEGPAAEPGEEVRAALFERLSGHLHPLTGGEAGGGYPLGRGLRSEDLAPIIAASIRNVGGTELGATPPRVAVVREVGAAEEGTYQVSPQEMPVLGAIDWISRPVARETDS
jgi:hypothetical protein